MPRKKVQQNSKASQKKPSLDELSQSHGKQETKSDLQTHATKVGLVPVDDMKMLRNRLLREFDKHISAYRTPKQTKSKKKLSKDALKILGEGK